MHGEVVGGGGGGWHTSKKHKKNVRFNILIKYCFFYFWKTRKTSSKGKVMTSRYWVSGKTARRTTSVVLKCIGARRNVSATLAL